MSLSHLKARSLGRLELLNWLNNFIQTDYSKIEHLSDGVGYCQILDALYPGKVPLRKVNFNPRSKDEYARNLRVCSDVLHACGVRKEVPVQRISSGKFQENYEFLCWCYELVNQVYPEANQTYQGSNRRSEVLYASNLLASSPPSKSKSKSKTKPRAKRSPNQKITTSPTQPPVGYGGMNSNLTNAKLSLLSQNMLVLEKALSGSFNDNAVPELQGGSPPRPRAKKYDENEVRRKGTPPNQSDLHQSSTPQSCEPLTSIKKLLDKVELSSEEFPEEQFSEIILDLERDLTIRLMQQKDLQNKIEELSNERDTYYKTLLAIESTCSDPKDSCKGTARELLQILSEPNSNVPKSKHIMAIQHQPS